MKRYIVMSGLPASGKSSVGKALASEMNCSFLDKDDFLEELFEQRGVGDSGLRNQLSRESDLKFQAAALASTGTVLASWWHHPRSPSATGTRIDWLVPFKDSCVEVHCRCEPAIAAERFMVRERHPGHLDRLRSIVAVRELFEEQARLGPLGIGNVVAVSTDSAVFPEGAASIAAEVVQLLRADGDD